MPPSACHNQGSKASKGKNITTENACFKNGSAATTKQ